VTKLTDLAREYEARHFPPTRRLDLQGEGPETARERALRWIQTFAHEAPGSDLLLVVERGRRPGHRKSVLRQAVEKLLDELNGGLIEWWQPFHEGSIALRVARDPRRWPAAPPPQRDPKDEGRTPETAGAAYLHPAADIPGELLPLARRVAEMRRTREGLGLALLDVVLRELWIQAQTDAMTRGASFEDALLRLEDEERRRMYEEE
jgi:hypothetical protein